MAYRQVSKFATWYKKHVDAGLTGMQIRAESNKFFGKNMLFASSLGMASGIYWRSQQLAQKGNYENFYYNYETEDTIENFKNKIRFGEVNSTALKNYSGELQNIKDNGLKYARVNNWYAANYGTRVTGVIPEETEIESCKYENHLPCVLTQ